MTSSGPQAEPLLPDVAREPPYASTTGCAMGRGGGPPVAPAGLSAEARLDKSRKVVTRLVTPGHRDDGYCSSDSTPKGIGESRSGALVAI